MSINTAKTVVPAADLAEFQAPESPQLVRVYNDLGTSPWWTTEAEIAACHTAQQ